MKSLIPLGALVYAIIFAATSHLGVEYFIPPLSLIISFVLIVRFRTQIAHWFTSLPIKPPFVLYLVAIFPFVIFEENINCFPPEAGGCRVFPVETIPFLYGQMIIIYFLIKKLKLKNPGRITIAYSLLGVLWEVTIGVSHIAFQALPPVWFIIIFTYTFISYAYFALIPFTIATKQLNN